MLLFSGIEEESKQTATAANALRVVELSAFELGGNAEEVGRRDLRSEVEKMGFCLHKDEFVFIGNCP